jgi:hypothetical protein
MKWAAVCNVVGRCDAGGEKVGIVGWNVVGMGNASGVIRDVGRKVGCR